MEVVPSIYKVGSMDTLPARSGPAGFDNAHLRVGEIKEVIYPEDAQSKTKKRMEYHVLVQHYENGTVAGRMYRNCVVADQWGGAADHQFQTLRSGGATDQKSKTDVGYGSKVLLLCINGEHTQAIIVSGVADQHGNDLGKKGKGHHLNYEFNGVVLEIHDDGSFKVNVKGPTNPDGSQKDDINTTVSVAATGDFRVETASGDEYIEVSHNNGTITLDAPKIKIGENAPEAAVLGDTLVQLLGELIDQLMAESHPTIWGPTGPPLNAPAYAAIRARLQTALSTFITVKK